MTTLQSFPSHYSLIYISLVLRSSPGLWAATAASYCPSRARELPKQNMTKSHERWDGKLCTRVQNHKLDAYKLWINILQYSDDSVISIQRNGTPEISPFASIQNDHVYSGSENDLILSQVYTTRFTCKYDMRAYPFDSQKCSMIFTMEVNHFFFGIMYNVGNPLSHESWYFVEHLWHVPTAIGLIWLPELMKENKIK